MGNAAQANVASAEFRSPPGQWTFQGGPNDGTTIQFTSRPRQVAVYLGQDRYVLRHGDRTLHHSSQLGVDVERFHAIGQRALRLLDGICADAEPLLEGQMMTVPAELISEARSLFV